MLKIKLNWVIAFCKIIAVMFYIRVKKIRVNGYLLHRI